MDEVCLGSRVLQLDRQLLAGGQRLHLGRRAIAILSTLARAKGEIVTKGELLEEVWHGISVEENALPVHVVALRKALGPDAGRLETVHGVGYRLVLGDDQHAGSDSEAARSEARPAAARNRRSLWLAMAGSGAALALLLGLSRAERPGVLVDSRILVPATQSDGVADAVVAANVHGALLEELSKAGLTPYGREDAGAKRDHQIVRTSITHAGGRNSVLVSIEDEASKTSLWSRRFDAADSDAQRLADQVATAAVRTIYAMREAYQQKGLHYDAPTMALHLRGSELLRNRQLKNDTTASEIFRQVAAAYPNSASAHGLLAVGLSVDLQSATADMRAPLLAEIEREAQRAIAIDPRASGAAYDALAMAHGLADRDDLVGYERRILTGTRSAPEFAFLHMRECRFLSDVGLERRALEYCRRAIALHPYAEPILHSYARVRQLTGDFNGANEFIDRSAYLFPDHAQIRRTRFEMAVFTGQSAKALAILGSAESLPEEIDPRQAAFWRDFLRSQGRWSASERANLAQQIAELSLAGGLSVDWAAMALVALGKTSQAFDLLENPALAHNVRTTTARYLFEATTAPMRSDPRFWRLAARLGLVRYWTASGNWPDFCGGEIRLEQCRNGAAAASLALTR